MEGVLLMRIVKLTGTDGLVTRLVIGGGEATAWEMNRFFSLDQDIASVEGDVISFDEVNEMERSEAEIDRAAGFVYKFHKYTNSL